MTDEVPDYDEITDISQVERMQEYVDNSILQFIVDTAAKVDFIQRAITTTSGTILIDVGKRIKKGLSNVSRQISAIQKATDYSTYTRADSQETGVQLPPEADSTDVTEVGDFQPGGLLPANDMSEPQTPVTPPDTSGCTRVYTDPNTCEIHCIHPDGSNTVVGMDQDCLNAKNNPPQPPKPPGPKPPQPPFNPFSPNCPFGHGDYSNSVSYLSWSSQSCQDAVYIQCTASPDVSLQLFSLRRPFDLLTVPGTAIDYTGGMRDDGQTWGCVDNIHAVVTIPYMRNSYDKLSIYTEQGENAVREKWNNSSISGYLDAYNTYDSFANSIWPKVNPGSLDYEIGFLSIPDEWGIA